MAYGDKVYSVGVQDAYGNVTTSQGNGQGITFTNGAATISGTTDILLTSVVHYFNKRFEIDMSGGASFLPTQNGGNHIFAYNCSFDVTGLPNAILSDVTHNFGKGWARQDSISSQSASFTFNLYNCLLTFPETGDNNAGFVVSRMEDSTVVFPVGSANGRGAKIFLEGGSVVKNSIFSSSSDYDAVFTIAFVPDEISGLTLDTARYGFSGAFSLLLIETDWADAGFSTAYDIRATDSGGNVFDLRRRGIQVIGAYKWADVAASMDSSHAFSSKIEFTGAGHDTSTYTHAHIIHHYGYEPTFNKAASTPAQGINVYFSSNAQVFGSGEGEPDWPDRFVPSNIADFAVNSSHQIINRYATDDNGKLTRSHYSRDGGTTWQAGAFNWLRLDPTFTSTDSAVLAQPYTAQNAPSNTAIAPLQMVVKSDTAGQGSTSLRAQDGIELKIDIRGYAYTTGENVTVLTEADLVTGANPIAKPTLFNLPSDVVLPANIDTSDRGARTALDTNLTTGAVASVNDIHDVVRWLWSDYQVDLPPVVSSGIAELRDTGSSRLSVDATNDVTAFERTGSLIRIPCSAVAYSSAENLEGLQGNNFSTEVNVTGGDWRFATWTIRSTVALTDLTIASGTVISVSVTGSDDVTVFLTGCDIDGVTFNKTGAGSGNVIVNIVGGSGAITTGAGVVRASTINLTFPTGITNIRLYPVVSGALDHDHADVFSVAVTGTTQALSTATYAALGRHDEFVVIAAAAGLRPYWRRLTVQNSDITLSNVNEDYPSLVFDNDDGDFTTVEFDDDANSETYNRLVVGISGTQTSEMTRTDANRRWQQRVRGVDAYYDALAATQTAPDANSGANITVDLSRGSADEIALDGRVFAFVSSSRRTREQIEYVENLSTGEDDYQILGVEDVEIYQTTEQDTITMGSIPLAEVANIASFRMRVQEINADGTNAVTATFIANVSSTTYATEADDTGRKTVIAAELVAEFNNTKDALFSAGTRDVTASVDSVAYRIIIAESAEQAATRTDETLGIASTGRIDPIDIEFQRIAESTWHTLTGTHVDNGQASTPGRLKTLEQGAAVNESDPGASAASLSAAVSVVLDKGVKVDALTNNGEKSVIKAVIKGG